MINELKHTKQLAQVILKSLSCYSREVWISTERTQTCCTYWYLAWSKATESVTLTEIFYGLKFDFNYSKAEINFTDAVSLYVCRSVFKLLLANL